MGQTTPQGFVLDSGGGQTRTWRLLFWGISFLSRGIYPWRKLRTLLLIQSKSWFIRDLLQDNSNYLDWIIINALKETNFTEKAQELSKENTEEAIKMNELEELRIRDYNSLMVFKR